MVIYINIGNKREKSTYNIHTYCNGYKYVVIYNRESEIFTLGGR